MIALVTGATGCVGSALCRHLLASEEFTEVRALVRGDRSGVPPGSLVYAGDLSDKSVLGTACAGADVVFHAAAKVHDPNGSLADFEEINVAGTARLLKAAEKTAVSRVVFFSTVAVYGESTPAEGIAEDAPPSPVTPYAQTKLRGEELVSAWAERTGRDALSLRLATVYGPRDRGNMARMMEAIRRGRFVLPGRGENKKTCVGVDNAAQIAMCAAMGLSAVRGPIVVADPGGAYRLRDLAIAMATAANVPSTRATRSVSTGILHFIADLFAIKAAIQGKRNSVPISRAQIDRLAANNVYLSRKMHDLNGNFCPLSLSQGLQISMQESGFIPPVA